MFGLCWQVEETEANVAVLVGEAANVVYSNACQQFPGECCYCRRVMSDSVIVVPL